MKLPILTCILTTAFRLSIEAALAAEPPALPKVANATNEFTITGMHCNGCAQGLTSELKRAAGVASATVSFTNRLAVVAFDTNRTSRARLVQVIEEAGFKASRVKK